MGLYGAVSHKIVQTADLLQDGDNNCDISLYESHHNNLHWSKDGIKKEGKKILHRL